MRSLGTTSVNRPSIGYSTPSGIRMTRRNTPPVRRSTSQLGVVSGAGVNQRETYSALLHASKTSRFGASKTRVMRSSGVALSVVALSAVVALFFSSTALLLFFELVQKSVE